MVNPLDDDELVQLATEPAERLFPLWDRAQDFLPLLVLLMVGPALYATQFRHLTEADAGWNLVTSDLYQERDISNLVFPDLETYPPLGHWLNLIPAHFHQVNPLINELLVSLLASATILGVLYFFAKQFLGVRFGVWIVLLLCCQSSFLIQSQLPPTSALAALTTMATILLWWKFLAAVRWYFVPLAAVMIALSWYAGGAIILPLLFVIVVELVVQSIRPLDSVKSKSRFSIRGIPGWKRAVALAILILISGGLVIPSLVAIWQQQPSFAALFQLPELNAPFATILDPSLLHMNLKQLLGDYLWTHQGWIGLTWLGLWRSRPGSLRILPSPSSRTLRFLRIWYLLAWGFWLVVSLITQPGSSFLGEELRLFSILPSALLAAVGIEEICESRIPSMKILVITCGSLLGASIGIIISHRSYPAEPLWWGMVVPVIMLLLSVLYWSSEEHTLEAERTRFLGTNSILAQLTLTFLLGLGYIQQHTPEDRLIEDLGYHLDTLEVSDCIMISPEGAPLRLQYLFRKLWPDCRFQVASDWNNGLSKFQSVRSNGQGGESRIDEESMIFVSWEPTEGRPGNINALGFELEEITRPRFLENRQLRVYQLIPNL